MNTTASEPRPQLFSLALIALACFCLGAAARADDWGAPRPRIFTSESGEYGFKVLPKIPAGVLFTIDDEGNEQVIWKKQLVNVPHQVFVADDGKHLVTIDTYADLGREHSLAIYDGKGNVIADYRLEELLDEQEIRDRVIETSPNRWWAGQASFKFRDRGQDIKYFEITLKWGKMITVRLDSGKLNMEKLPDATLNRSNVSGTPPERAARPAKASQSPGEESGERDPKDLQAQSEILKAEVTRLNLQLLKSLESLLGAEPDNLAVQSEAAVLASQLAPKSPGNRIVWRVLIATRTLKDGMSLGDAEKLLGPPTGTSGNQVEWYFNPPPSRHVAPFLRARITGERLTEWTQGQR